MYWILSPGLVITPDTFNLIAAAKWGNSNLYFSVFYLSNLETIYNHKKLVEKSSSTYVDTLVRMFAPNVIGRKSKPQEYGSPEFNENRHGIMKRASERAKARGMSNLAIIPV